MECKKCGTTILPEDEFCKYCGATLHANDFKFNIPTTEEENVEDLTAYSNLALTKRGLIHILEGNSFFSFLLSLAPFFALAYPIYLVMENFYIFHEITSFIAPFYSILKIGFFFSVVACFAANLNTIQCASFCILTINHFIAFFETYETLRFNELIYIVFFAVLTVASYKVPDDDIQPYNRSFIPFPLKYILIICVIIAAVLLIVIFISSLKTCDNCGKIITEGYEVLDKAWCKDCFLNY